MPVVAALFASRHEHVAVSSTKEGVGETSGQTAGSYFGRAFFQKKPALSEPVRQKKQVFLRSVRVSLTTRNFTGPTPGTKSGPDVFADALVPGTSLFPERSRSRNAPFPGTPAFAGALRYPMRQAS